MGNKKNTNLYFIHGNGQNNSCAPKGFLCDNIPGHGIGNWDKLEYKLDRIVDYFCQQVPLNAHVFTHSLGGHIGINLALKRRDINLTCFGTVPLQSPDKIGSIMKVTQEFINFQKPDRTMSEVNSFCEISSCGDVLTHNLLVSAAMEQDPNFNSLFFSQGLLDYDWSEVDKAQELGCRFRLIISKNEEFYDYNQTSILSLPLIFDHYRGHSPWLLDNEWIKKYI